MLWTTTASTARPLGVRSHEALEQLGQRATMRVEVIRPLVHPEVAPPLHRREDPPVAARQLGIEVVLVRPVCTPEAHALVVRGDRHRQPCPTSIRDPEGPPRERPRAVGGDHRVGIDREPVGLRARHPPALHAQAPHLHALPPLRPPARERAPHRQTHVAAADDADRVLHGPVLLRARAAAEGGWAVGPTPQGMRALRAGFRRPSPMREQSARASAALSTSARHTHDLA